MMILNKKVLAVAVASALAFTILPLALAPIKASADPAYVTLNDYMDKDDWACSNVPNPNTNAEGGGVNLSSGNSLIGSNTSDALHDRLIRLDFTPTAFSALDLTPYGGPDLTGSFNCGFMLRAASEFGDQAASGSKAGYMFSIQGSDTAANGTISIAKYDAAGSVDWTNDYHELSNADLKIQLNKVYTFEIGAIDSGAGVSLSFKVFDSSGMLLGSVAHTDSTAPYTGKGYIVFNNLFWCGTKLTATTPAPEDEGPPPVITADKVTLNQYLASGNWTSTDTNGVGVRNIDTSATPLVLTVLASASLNGSNTNANLHNKLIQVNLTPKGFSTMAGFAGKSDYQFLLRAKSQFADQSAGSADKSSYMFSFSGDKNSAEGTITLYKVASGGTMREIAKKSDASLKLAVDKVYTMEFGAIDDGANVNLVLRVYNDAGVLLDEVIGVDKSNPYMEKGYLVFGNNLWCGWDPDNANFWGANLSAYVDRNGSSSGAGSNPGSSNSGSSSGASSTNSNSGLNSGKSSEESPKTGSASPILLVTMMGIVSGSAVLALKRKKVS